jgi:hypothetical protein
MWLLLSGRQRAANAPQPRTRVMFLAEQARASSADVKAPVEVMKWQSKGASASDDIRDRRRADRVART